MKEFFIPQLGNSDEKLKQMQQGLNNFARFVETPSKIENVETDAEIAASYLAHLNFAQLAETIKKLQLN